MTYSAHILYLIKLSFLLLVLSPDYEFVACVFGIFNNFDILNHTEMHLNLTGGFILDLRVRAVSALYCCSSR